MIVLREKNQDPAETKITVGTASVINYNQFLTLHIVHLLCTTQARTSERIRKIYMKISSQDFSH